MAETPPGSPMAPSPRRAQAVPPSIGYHPREAPSHMANHDPKSLVCIRNEPGDTLGLAPGEFTRAGLEVLILDGWDSASWPGPEDVAGVVVFGGEMNAEEVDRYPFLSRERDLLREAVAANTPVLGVCLGGQLLARALGARVGEAPASELGFFPLSVTEEGRRDPLLSAFSDGHPVFEWHRDAFELPGEATLLATGRSGDPQAYRAAPLAWGLQFHPEVTGAQLEGWLAEAEPTMERVWGRTPEAVREEARARLPGHQQRARRLLGTFARAVRERRTLENR